MSDEKLNLADLRVRVEATFDWPLRSEDDSGVSMPEVADEIGQRLHSFERHLSTPSQSTEVRARDISSSFARGLLPLADEAASVRLEQRIASLEERESHRDAAESDNAALWARIDELEKGSDEQRQSTRETLDAFDARLDACTSRLEELTALSARLESIEVRLAELDDRQRLFDVTVGELHTSVEQRVAEVEARARATEGTAPESLQELIGRLSSLQAQIDSVLSLSGEAVLLDERVSALERHQEPQDAVSEELAQLGGRLRHLEERLDASSEPVTVDHEPLDGADAVLEKESDTPHLEAPPGLLAWLSEEDEPSGSLEGPTTATAVADFAAEDAEERDLLDERLTEIVFRNLRSAEAGAIAWREIGTSAEASDDAASDDPTSCSGASSSGVSEDAEPEPDTSRALDFADMTESQEPESSLDILRGGPEPERAAGGGRLFKKIRR